MCCIFTCVAWFVDALQRAWVFAMSCCIGSAICVLLVIASVAGVALGYNYSMAEYVQLRETNVSVFLKRGVFDDVVVDEMDWRRGGGGPPAAERSGPTRNFDSDGNVRRSMPGEVAETDFSPPPGRRLDDAIIMADNSRRFEGALQKLTGVAANLAATPKLTTERYESGSPLIDTARQPMVAQNAHEQLKNIAAMNNRRVLDLNPTPLHGPPTTEKTTATIFGSTYEYPHQIRRFGDDFDHQLNMKMEKSMLAERLRERILITDMPGLPPGPYGEFMKKQLYKQNLAPLMRESINKPLDAGEFNPVEELQARLDSHSTEPGPVVIYNTEENKFRAEANTKAYEEDDIVTKVDSKSSESDYDEDDIKGLPMRRKREIKYVTSVSRIINHHSTTRKISDSYRPHGIKSKKDFKERKGQTFLPKGSLYESNTITTLFRKLASQIS